MWQEMPVDLWLDLAQHPTWPAVPVVTGKLHIKLNYQFRLVRLSTHQDTHTHTHTHTKVINKSNNKYLKYLNFYFFCIWTEAVLSLRALVVMKSHLLVFPPHQMQLLPYHQ